VWRAWVGARYVARVDLLVRSRLAWSVFLLSTVGLARTNARVEVRASAARDPTGATHRLTNHRDLPAICVLPSAVYFQGSGTQSLFSAVACNKPGDHSGSELLP
jgi:hypothetical protein